MRVTKKSLCVAVAFDEMFKANEEFDLYDFIESAKKINLPLEDFVISHELEKTIVSYNIDPKNVVDYLICIFSRNGEQMKREGNTYFNNLIRDQFIMPTVLRMLQAT